MPGPVVAPLCTRGGTALAQFKNAETQMELKNPLQYQKDIQLVPTWRGDMETGLFHCCQYHTPVRISEGSALAACMAEPLPPLNAGD